MNSGPNRAFELVIKIGGDTWEDVMRDVRFLERHLPEHGPTCSSVMGGPDSHHIVAVRVDPAMTHDKYFEEVDAYLAELRAKEAAAKEKASECTCIPFRDPGHEADCPQAKEEAKSA